MMIEEAIGIFEEYLQNKRELSDSEISEIVDSIPKDSLFYYTYSPDVPLFRARYESDSLKITSTEASSIDQYSYIHKLDAIKTFRYNKAEEAVLYTATKPEIAYAEIGGDIGVNVFLSQWRLSKSYKFALNINECNTKGSFAYKLYQEVLSRVGKEKAKLYSKLGQILEWPSGSDSQRVYRLTSAIASKILQSCDAIMTTSAKSDGKELNITFNKKSSDELSLNAVYLMAPPKDPKNSLLGVKKVGKISAGAISWHDFMIDMSSIRIDRTLNCPEVIPPNVLILNRKTYSSSELSKLINAKDASIVSCMVPNINQTYKERNTGIAIDVLNGYKYIFSFIYKLI